MNKIFKKTVIKNVLLFLTIFSFFIQAINIDIGFTLKPFHVMAIFDLLFLVISRPKIKFSLTVLEKVFLLFFLTVLISIPFGIDQLSSMKHAGGILVLFLSFLIFRLFLQCFEKKSIVKALEVVAFVYLVITLIMYIAGLLYLGFDYHRPNVDILGVTIDRNTPRLISLSYMDPNISTIYFAIPLSFFLSIKTRSIKKKIGIIGYIIVILLTLSRGGIIALVVMFFVYIIGSIKLKKKASVAPVFSITIIERFKKSISDGGSGRLQLWNWAIDAFSDNPLTGIGAGNISIYNELYHHRFAPSHNSYLDVLVEQGIIGFLLYSLFIVVVFMKSWKIRRDTIFPLLSIIFLIVSQLFLSLAISDLLFINVLIIELATFFIQRKKTLSITKCQTVRKNKKNTTKDLTRVSIIVPVYNVEHYIKKCLETLVHQTVSRYEVIIVDDGSTDKSSEICKCFSDEYDFVKYYRTKNGGLSAARNYGAKKAKGEYLWFVDSDDFIAYDSLERLQKYLSHDIVTVGYYNYYDDYTITDGNDCCASDNISRFFLNPALAQLKIVSSRLFDEKKVVFEVGRNFEDIGTMYSLAKYTDDICHSGEKVYFYRRRQGSITTTFSEKNYLDHLWAIDQINAINNKKYKQELEYQSILQVLFMAFDAPREKDGLRQVIKDLKEYITKHNPNYRDNVYLKKKNLKNTFYRIYITRLMGEKIWSCMMMNRFRDVAIKRRS